MDNDTAILSNEGPMTIFEYGAQRIKFKSPDCLDHYEEIKLWDKGYIVVLTYYKGIGTVEEYIDLVPILENLYIDKNDFLKPIRHVIVKKISTIDYDSINS